MEQEDILQQLKAALMEYDKEGTASLAKKVLEEKIDPVLALDALTDGIRYIGDLFGKGELFLPELVGGAEAMQAATPILGEELRRRGGKRKTLGTVVVGTVSGDIHSIGKAMVCTLLTAGGFEVHDLGVDIPANEFVQAMDEYKPDILAMSALLTTTAAEQKKVIEALEQSGTRGEVKIIVGGGAITPEFAESIGADGYDPTAPGAVELARKLMGEG